MATKPNQQVANSITGPQHYLPPTVRDLRAQTVQRLQAGLFGLAAMLLLVGLANIVLDRARLADAEAGTGAGMASAAPPAGAASGAGDPLADIGVVPAPDPSAAASALPSARGGPRN